MTGRAVPDEFEGAQGDNDNAAAAMDDPFDILDRQERPRAIDGDGAMLGRVLIYASIITVIVAVIIWKQFV